MTEQQAAFNEYLALSAELDAEFADHVNSMTDEELLRQIKEFLFNPYNEQERSSTMLAVVKEWIMKRESLWING